MCIFDTEKPRKGNRRIFARDKRNCLSARYLAHRWIYVCDLRVIVWFRIFVDENLRGSVLF